MTDLTSSANLVPADAMWSGIANVQGVYFVIAVCLCAMLGNNRSKLQLALGMPDAGCINYVLCAPQTLPL